MANILPEVWTALVTPFDSTGKIDFGATARLLALQAEGGVTGVVISGTTGESPTLSDVEKLELVKFARKELPNSIRVMAGTGSNDTAHNIRLSQAAGEAGADSLLIVTPPYNKPSPAGLHRHFSEIASKSKLPICLYHVPGRTGQLLAPGAIAKLTEVPGIKWVKEASGDLTLFGRAALLSKATFLSGDDFTYLPSLTIGGRGVISVLTNVFPKAFVAMGNYLFSGEVQRAERIHKILLPFIDALFCESNPGPVKAALNMANLCKNVVRMPLAEVTPESFQLIRNQYDEAKSHLRGLGLLEKVH
jgi:4-hydroxy-tetrahydrodipicolinate synthase